MYKREFVGEFIGTFILVLFGCGSVAISVLFDSHQGLFQIAAVWGIGVSLAIYATRHISCAHLNPAVTLAMVATKRMVARKMPIYLAAQFIGAFTSGLVLYLLFGSAIASFENLSGIIRGTTESIATAKIFGEFYINNGNPGFSLMLAAIAEAFGTFLLVIMIFSLTEGCNLGRPDDNLAPIFIGLTVTSVICLLAPLTQAGLNPARDFGPRMVAWIFGWGQAAFPDQSGGFFFVYMLAPVIGGQVAGLLFTRVMEPLMRTKNEDQCCCGNDKTLKVKEDVK